MRREFARALVVLAATAALFAPLSATAQSEDGRWALSRTADGQPDLQGVWANNIATPLERPDELAGKESLTAEEVAALQVAADRLFGGGGDAAFGDGVFAAALSEAATYTSGDAGTGNYSSVWMADRDFDNRTSLITDPNDGKLPPQTPAAQGRQADERARGRLGPFNRPEDLGLTVRCISYGMPRVGGVVGAGYNSYYQIFQTPENVAILGEMIHDARVIPLDGRAHIRDGIRQWHGDSRGRWDGDSLIVETTNFSPKSRYLGSSDNLHLVERFTRVGPDTIHYEITVTDPTNWTRPWTAMVPLKKTEDAIFEYACHEGNYGMTGILAGGRVQDANTGTDTPTRP